MFSFPEISVYHIEKLVKYLYLKIWRACKMDVQVNSNSNS